MHQFNNWCTIKSQNLEAYWALSIFYFRIQALSILSALQLWVFWASEIFENQVIWNFENFSELRCLVIFSIFWNPASEIRSKTVTYAHWHSHSDWLDVTSKMIANVEISGNWIRHFYRIWELGKTFHGDLRNFVLFVRPMISEILRGLFLKLSTVDF